MTYSYYGRRNNSIFDVFTLNPLPYPVLLILAVISIFLGMSWYFSYEEMVEAAEEQMSWVLLIIPLVILFVVRWLSSMENPDMLFAKSPWEWKRQTHHHPPEGSSPWGVAALIVLLLVLVQFQSAFLDSWF
ncbi:uncharacterized protein LOC8285147 [Ricinus communis]|uniref:uncharacterized protein LOC8285147 n=1 Tax=Ricinus communis TaxID=3988 RepID=UPI00201A96B6|nr:uncharacterized protein LOC8285147 [Ricinus communis]